MRDSTINLLSFLRFKRDSMLCDRWVSQNFGYWGNAPIWAEEALQRRDSNSISSIAYYKDGFIHVDTSRDGLYTFCKITHDPISTELKIMSKLSKRDV